MKISGIAATLTALALAYILPVAGANAQETAQPTIKLQVSEARFCSTTGGALTISPIIGGLTQSEVENYSRLDLQWDNGNGAITLLSWDTKTEIKDLVCDAKNVYAGTSYDEQTGTRDYKATIYKAMLRNSDLDQISLTPVTPYETTWHVYGTPRTDNLLDETDPRRLVILGDSRACGFDYELSTNPGWASVSTYEWSVSNTDQYTIEGNGNTATLSQIRNADRGSNVKTTNVTVIQTVGGVCQASYTKEVTLMGRPDATLSLDEEKYPEGAILICTNADEADDQGRRFSALVDLIGDGPMTVTLSTGDRATFGNIDEGVKVFANAYVDKAGRVTITKVVDDNGCVSDSSTPDLIHGGVSVTDRTPQPGFATDSIFTREVKIDLSVDATDDTDSFSWGIKSRGYDSGIDGWGTQSTAWSNMAGRVDYYVVETMAGDALTGQPECPSDTAFIAVYFDMPLRYPNAISPNGDNVNDKLVIEGLPANNTLFVYDGRGKKVYEKVNYRNQWSADGLDDGYYAYVLKGDGISTIKETLAIKRN